MSMYDMPESAMQPIANHALHVFPDLNVPGYEASKVFALTALYLSQPPVRFQETLQNIHRQELARAYEFVVHASRYPKSAHQHSPASPVETWHVLVTRKGFRVGKGQVRGKYARSRLEKVVIECADRDLVNLATGKARRQRLYETGKLKIKGDLTKAREISKIIATERSNLAKSAAPSPHEEAKQTTDEFDEQTQGLSAGVVPRAKL